MIVLDTNVLSEVMRVRPHPRVIDWVDAEDPNALAITSITVAELQYGVSRLDHGARRASLQAALHAFVDEDFAGRVLPFDASAAETYGRLVADREARGAPISMADAQIASICRQRGASLATRNERDFSGLDLELHDPWSKDR